MTWNENLYALHQTIGGQFLGTMTAVGGWEQPLPDGVLLLSHRQHQLVVCATSDLSQAVNGSEGQLWTRVLTQAELRRPIHVEVRPENLLDKGLDLLKGLGRKDDDWSVDRWEPEGYETKTNDPAFARMMLQSPDLRRRLDQARKKDPVRLPLSLRIHPTESEEDPRHVVEVRTTRFPREWAVLGGWSRGDEIVPARQTETESVELLRRLVETAKALCDAVCNVPL